MECHSKRHAQRKPPLRRTSAEDQPETEPIPVIPRTQFDFDVAVVGLGYVGLPTALSLHASGARVLGIDLSERRLDLIRNGEADLLESDRERLESALSPETIFRSPATPIG